MRFCLPVVLAVVLCACGQQSAPEGAKAALDTVPDAGPCDRFEAPLTIEVIASNCNGCTISNPELAIDGDLRTYAIVTVPANPLGTGTMAVRVSSPTAMPPHLLPGAFISWQASLTAPFVGEGYDVNTYLLGEFQETSDYAHTIGRTGPSAGYAGGQTTKPFDAVEFKLFQPTQTAAIVNLHDFCSDGG
ncbi:MAG: hypothetical protein WC809_00580 [Sinimarinibacterium sp.]|jgi:hypothetical protein